MKLDELLEVIVNSTPLVVFDYDKRTVLYTGLNLERSKALQELAKHKVVYLDSCLYNLLKPTTQQTKTRLEIGLYPPD
jgi:hypothetical protein